MFYCNNCGGKFEKPEKSIETHGFKNPPYEEIYLCPYCNSDDFYEKESEYCRCCGVKLKHDEKNYCSEKCREKRMLLWKKELKRRNKSFENPLSMILRELEAYNKKNNTDLSYGKYVAHVKAKEKEDKNNG